MKNIHDDRDTIPTHVPLVVPTQGMYANKTRNWRRGSWDVQLLPYHITLQLPLNFDVKSQTFRVCYIVKN